MPSSLISFLLSDEEILDGYHGFPPLISDTRFIFPYQSDRQWNPEDADNPLTLTCTIVHDATLCKSERASAMTIAIASFQLHKSLSCTIHYAHCRVIACANGNNSI